MAKKVLRLKIDEWMQKRGMSTAELVEKTGMAYNTALGLRRGVVTRVDLDVLARVCEALDIQPGDLFELVEAAKK
jgi:DNA-binding Xre family transcriptional regulator